VEGRFYQRQHWQRDLRSWNTPHTVEPLRLSRCSRPGSLMPGSMRRLCRHFRSNNSDCLPGTNLEEWPEACADSVFARYRHSHHGSPQLASPRNRSACLRLVVVAVSKAEKVEFRKHFLEIAAIIPPTTTVNCRFRPHISTQKTEKAKGENIHA